MNPIATRSTAAKSPAARALAAKSPKTKSGNGKLRTIVIGVVAAMLILPASIWAWMHYRHLSRLQKAKQVAAETFGNRGNQSVTPEQRRQNYEQARQAIDALGLSEAERDELRRAQWDERLRRDNERMAKYAAMSEKERWAYLQKQVADMAKRFDQNGGKNGGGLNNSSRGNNATANAGNGPRGSGGGPGGRGNRSPDQRLQAQKRRLDRSSPDQRAARTLYNSDLARAVGQQNSIRLQQGLPPIPTPRTRAL